MGRPSTVQLQAAVQEARAPWRDHAACRGLADLMDPPRPTRTTQEIQAAKDVCWACPVMWDCRDWARSLPESLDTTAVLGGLTEPERTRFRNRARGLAAARTVKARASVG